MQACNYVAGPERHADQVVDHVGEVADVGGQDPAQCGEHGDDQQVQGTEVILIGHLYPRVTVFN
jgi:hypothetical protein